MPATFYKSIYGWILTSALMAMAIVLPAQTEKGMYIIGGSTNISESIQSTSNTFSLALQPSFGAFVIRNFAIGGTYSFSVSSAKTVNAKTDVRTTTSTFNTLVGPFLKYYIGKKPMKPFVSANGGYSVFTQIKSTSTPGSNASITNYDGFSMGASVGIAYFFNPHVALESALYINTSGYQTQIPTTRFGFSLGLYTFLDKKKAE
jgi:hypothetical protein